MKGILKREYGLFYRYWLLLQVVFIRKQQGMHFILITHTFLQLV